MFTAGKGHFGSEGLPACQGGGVVGEEGCDRQQVGHRLRPPHCQWLQITPPWWHVWKTCRRYESTFGQEGWGYKAQQVLGQVRGKWVQCRPSGERAILAITVAMYLINVSLCTFHVWFGDIWHIHWWCSLAYSCSSQGFPAWENEEKERQLQGGSDWFKCQFLV